jgi:hypothetical protein
MKRPEKMAAVQRATLRLKSLQKERLNLYTHQYRATSIGLVVGKSASGEDTCPGVTFRALACSAALAQHYS